MSGRSHQHVWLAALDVQWALLWIALLVAGATAVPRESGACLHLFVFPPPLGGGGVRVCVCVSWQDACVGPHPQQPV
jgi:hypothetical protein